MKSYIESWLIRPFISSFGHWDLIHHVDELSNIFIYFLLCRGKLNHSSSKTDRSWKVILYDIPFYEWKNLRKVSWLFKTRPWIHGRVEIRSWCCRLPGQSTWTQSQHLEKSFLGEWFQASLPDATPIPPLEGAVKSLLPRTSLSTPKASWQTRAGAWGT